jgi:hypothetical protein
MGPGSKFSAVQQIELLKIAVPQRSYYLDRHQQRINQIFEPQDQRDLFEKMMEKSAGNIVKVSKFAKISQPDQDKYWREAVQKVPSLISSLDVAKQEAYTDFIKAEIKSKGTGILSYVST